MKAIHYVILKIVLCINFLFCSYFFISAQTKKIVLNEIKVIDSLLFKTIDTVLIKESQYSYFSDNLPYGIYWNYKKAVFDNEKQDTVIVAYIAIAGFENEDIFLADKNTTGYFEYEGHRFFIRGKNDLPDCFKITNKKKTFRHNISFFVNEDDRWTFYIILYYNGQFILYKEVEGIVSKN